MPATKIQTFKRLLDASDASLWVIDASGRLVYLSAAMEAWLGVDPTELLDRMCLAGTPISNDPLDQLAASLSPPPGLGERGTASLQLQPLFPKQGKSVVPKLPSRETRFVRVGSDDGHLIIAVAGRFNDRANDEEFRDAVMFRQLLDQQRREAHSAYAAITAGTSKLARRLRHRLKIASSGRYDVLLVGNRGFCGDKIAVGLHEASTSTETFISIDGGLMDVELLEASLSPVTLRLVESSSAEATAIIKGVDRMPREAQDRLATLHLQFEGRLRLIATCRQVKETMHREVDAHPQDGEMDHRVSEELLLAEKSCLTTKLVDLFCAQMLWVPPIVHRVEDIPLMATALVDHCHAHGNTAAQCINRAALDALVIYPWPHDYREFEETVRGAARMASGAVIGKHQLPLAVRSYRPGDPAVGAQAGNTNLDEAVKRYQSQLIRAAVDSSDGNRAEAARRLGISRARLLRKLDEMKKSDADT